MRALDKKVEKSCLNNYMKKIPTPLLIFLLASIIIPSAISLTKVVFGQDTFDLKYATRDECSQQKQELALLQTKFIRMNADIQEIKNGINKQNQEINNGFSELKDIIKDGGR